MNTVRKEVRDLISLNERIQSALLRGELMTETESGIIRMCATEMLDSMGNMDRKKPDPE